MMIKIIAQPDRQLTNDDDGGGGGSILPQPPVHYLSRWLWAETTKAEDDDDDEKWKCTLNWIHARSFVGRAGVQRREIDGKNVCWNYLDDYYHHWRRYRLLLTGIWSPPPCSMWNDFRAANWSICCTLSLLIFVVEIPMSNNSWQNVKLLNNNCQDQSQLISFDGKLIVRKLIKL